MNSLKGYAYLPQIGRVPNDSASVYAGAV